MITFRLSSTVVALVLVGLVACSTKTTECPESKPCPMPPVSAPVPTQSISDTPNQHNMFILGDQTLFVEHMPMFTKEDHMYQLILRVDLPENVARTYRELRRTHPAKIPNLVNNEHHLMTLPALATGELVEVPVDVYADYDGANAQPRELLFSSVPMRILQLIRARHFDYSFDYPGELTYIMFGRDDEAHLAHYISRDPDFQHLLTLPRAPDWISADTISLLPL